MTRLREHALAVLLCTDASQKAELGRAPIAHLAIDATPPKEIPNGIPGRPDRPILIAHTAVKYGAVATIEGRAALLHALAHIELNAIDLAADAVWRFGGMPEDYYRDWACVMQEESLHFQLIRDHLATLGYAYGDFPAHHSLWEMAERTARDVLARMALVPRTLEARGLDASPGVRNKLISVGDRAGAAIIDIILRDEIGHVSVGNRWYGWLCQQRDLEPVSTYAKLAEKHQAPRLKGPFNLSARQAAGFSSAELDALIYKQAAQG